MRLAAAAIASFCLVLSGSAEAQSTVVTEHARTSLSAEQAGVAPGGETTLVFRQELRDGWHVYWKNPGDSGLPLEFKWTLPEGVEAEPILYPVPERIPVGPLANFGHKGAPVFLASIKAPEGAKTGSVIPVELKATWLICEEICVPETGEFELALPVTAQPAPVPEIKRIADAARAAQPKPLQGARFSATADSIVLEIPFEGVVRSAYFFPEAEGLIEPAAEQTLSRGDETMRLVIAGGYALDPQTLNRLEGVLTVEAESGRRGFDISATRAGEPVGAQSLAIAAGGKESARLPRLITAAFLGGILLNLMPCVFPILFVKAASFAETASRRPAALRRGGVLYAAGVIATFAALAALLFILRAAGAGLGWGFHLQSPVVVALSAYILFLVGLNFLGAYSVGESLQGVGAGAVAREGDLSAFLTGTLAVFVAAPCIGPFLTAPVGAAVILPVSQGFAIFMAMALGLAAPYLAVSFAPALARRLPRPGPWMTTFRRILAIPVLIAAAYFIWVLSRQTGAAGLAVGLAGLILLAAAAFLFERGKSARGHSMRVAAAFAALLAVAPLATLSARADSKAQLASYGDIRSVAFDPAEVARLRAAGKPLFIDFTAAWCVTCQVNKLTVLSSPRVANAFRANSVTVMTADWTRRDPVIEKALAGHGASGVPLYVYYPAGGAAKVLDQPLTANAIVDLFNKELKQ